MAIIEVILFVIFAHFIADWGLQTQFMSDNKNKYWFVMLAHCMVWTGTVSFVLYYFGIFSLWKALFLLNGHFVCDWIRNRREGAYFYADQTWHIVQCIIVGVM